MPGVALELLTTSAGAVLTVLLMMSGGALVAYRGFLPADAIKQMNRLNLQLLLPCMLFTRVSQSASLRAWSACWVLPAAAIVQLALGFAASTAYARAARLPPGRARVFRMAGTFGNSQAFPMVVLKLVAEDLLADDDGASDRAMAYVAYYLVCWSIVCWSAGWAFISAPLPPDDGDEAKGGASHARTRRDGADAEEGARAKARARASDVDGAGAARAHAPRAESGGSPAAVRRQFGGSPAGRRARDIELCAARDAPESAPAEFGARTDDGADDGGAADDDADLRELRPSGARAWLGGCTARAGALPSVGAHPATPRAGWGARAAVACGTRARAALASQALSPPVVAVLCGLVVGMAPPLRAIFVGPGAPLHLLHRAALLLGDSVVPLSTLLSGASLVAAGVPSDGGGGRGGGVSSDGGGAHASTDGKASACAARVSAALCRAELLGVIGVRLCIVPLCSWLLFVGARRHLGLFPRAADAPASAGAPLVDPLIGFVVLLEGAMPTANNVVMMVTIAHDERLSQLAAMLMAAQVVLLPLTLVGWMTLFLATVYT